MHQYAIYGKGKTIHASPQLEHYGNKVDNRSRKIGGKQRITTLEGYLIPLQIRQGLPYFKMSPPSDDDLDCYPHVILTSDMDWDPSILDNEINLNHIEQEMDNLPLENVYGDIHFDPQGNYCGVFVSKHQSFLSTTPSPETPPTISTTDFEEFMETTIAFVCHAVNYRHNWTRHPPDLLEKMKMKKRMKR